MQESPGEPQRSKPRHLPVPIQNILFFRRQWALVGLGIASALVLVVGVVVTVHMLTRKSNQPHPGQNQQNQQGNYRPPTGRNFQALAACSNQPPLTTVPTILSDYYQISPLGNVSVPDHALPTDHQYFQFAAQGGKSNLLAPGKIVVTNIMNSGETHTDGRGTNTNDYAITFYACKGVYFVFGHVQALTGPLGAAVQGEWDRPCERHTPAPGEETFYCNKTTDIVLNASDTIGTVGGKVGLGAFDFGAHKVAYTDPGFVRPERYPTVDAVCGLDYFAPVAKESLMKKVLRTAVPRCGNVGQDVKGTAQGNWFSTQNLQQGMSDWSTNLSFVHDSLEPSLGVIAVAGQISSPGVYHYHPTPSGAFNRDPSGVKPGDTVYCYSNNASTSTNGAGTPAQGKILIRLLNATTMKAEHQDGTCTSNEQLKSPTTYYR